MQRHLQGRAMLPSVHAHSGKQHSRFEGASPSSACGRNEFRQTPLAREVTKNNRLNSPPLRLDPAVRHENAPCRILPRLPAVENGQLFRKFFHKG